MQCPKCSAAMEPKKIDDLEIDVCSNCAGLWFDQGELTKSKDLADPTLAWMDFHIWKHEDQFRFSQQATNCPRCQINMVTVNYGSTKVEIDFCPKCRGTWLDEGKFSDIIDALESESAQKSIPEYVTASLAEAKDLITGPETFIAEWRDFTNVLKMLEYRFFSEHPDLQDTMIGIQKGFR